MQAAINAGFAREQIDTLNEPTAAAICYCLENNSVDEKILVYDLGGGTFDVSLLRVHNNEFVVLGCDGDNAFGGVDIDKCVMELLMEKYEAKFGAPLVSASMEEKKKTRYNRQIQAMSELTKIILSTTSETSVDFSELDHVLSTENNDDDQLVVTREEMEGAIRPLIDKTIITLRHLLSEAEVAAKDVDSVVIVGGSSHIPLVRETLRREFGDAKVTLGVDPSECVARGGCVSIVKGVRSQELATFSLGTSLENNEVMWIIPYHSPLPVTYTTSVMTAEDYAEQVRTNVVEGHGSTSGLVEMVTPDMVTLPMYSFTGFPRRPKGEVAFDITYTMKENGTLFITAKEKATGRVLLDSFEVTCFEWFCVLQQTRTLLALSRGLDASGSSSRLHHLRPVLSSLRRLLERQGRLVDRVLHLPLLLRQLLRQVHDLWGLSLLYWLCWLCRLHTLYQLRWLFWLFWLCSLHTLHRLCWLCRLCRLCLGLRQHACVGGGVDSFGGGHEGIDPLGVGNLVCGGGAESLDKREQLRESIQRVVDHTLLLLLQNLLLALALPPRQGAQQQIGKHVAEARHVVAEVHLPSTIAVDGCEERRAPRTVGVQDLPCCFPNRNSREERTYTSAAPMSTITS